MSRRRPPMGEARLEAARTLSTMAAVAGVMGLAAFLAREPLGLGWMFAGFAVVCLCGVAIVCWYR